MNSLKLSVALVCFLNTSLVLHAVQLDIVEVTKALFADDSDQRETAHREILNAKESLNTDSRTNLIHVLVKGIEAVEKDMSKEDSIRRALLILGEMPEKEAVEALVARIAFPRVSPLSRPPG